MLTQLKGTGVALVTPFSRDMSVDHDALARLIDHVIAGGVNYIVTLGTTGETPTLRREEKKEVIRFTCDRVGARVPVIVGIGGNDTAALVDDLETFPLEQATAILSASPYYSKPSQEGLFQHYKVLAEASPKPILLYNVPGRTGRNLAAHTTLRLARLPNIVGIKEASGDMQQCMLLLRDRPEDFLVVSGDDALALPQIACGMDGIISVAANAFPGRFSQMVNHCMAGQFEDAKRLNDGLIYAYELMFTENNPAGVKAFLHIQGLVQNVLRLPLVPVSDGLLEQIDAFKLRTSLSSSR